MTLPLCARRTLPLCYEMLKSTPPFRGWGMPSAEEVEFRVIRSRHIFGSQSKYVRTTQLIIEISEARVGHTHTLVETMAHEMAHLAQEVAGTTTSGAEHNADFVRRWRLICRYHGFDPKAR